MAEESAALENRVVILNGFSDPEIMTIMAMVKSIYAGNAGEVFGRVAELIAADPALASEAKHLVKAVKAARDLPREGVAPGDLIFAKTTPTSLTTRLDELIIDMSGDHAYLKENPPQNMSGAKGAGSSNGDTA